jgi:hypothetical protein
VNLYVFVNNDPVNKTDSTGRDIDPTLRRQFEDLRGAALSKLYYGTQGQFEVAYARWGAIAKEILAAYNKETASEADIIDATSLYDEWLNTDTAKARARWSAEHLAAMEATTKAAAKELAGVDAHLAERENKLQNTQTVGVVSGSAAAAAPVATSAAAGEVTVAAAKATQVVVFTGGVTFVNSEIEDAGVPAEYVEFAEAPILLYGAGRAKPEFEIKRVRVPKGYDIAASRGGTVEGANVDAIKKAMMEGSYEYTSPRGRVGGFRTERGGYVVGEGHHRMTAAFEAFAEGNTKPLTNLLTEGVWTPGAGAPVRGWPGKLVPGATSRGRAWVVLLPGQEER